MILNDVRNNRLVGSVHDPFDCCNPNYIIKDENKNIKYRISAACCQKGFYCCSDIYFYIYPAGDLPMVEENAIGKITKLWTDCMKEACTKANNFLTVFPKDATVDDKVLLIGATLLIDYTLFEKEEN
jgi:hypothetical protein